MLCEGYVMGLPFVVCLALSSEGEIEFVTDLTSRNGQTSLFRFLEVALTAPILCKVFLIRSTTNVATRLDL